MPDETKQGAVRYGCHSKPRPVAGKTQILVQCGYEDPVNENWGWFSKKPKYAYQLHTMSTDCRYDKSAVDRQCAGCPHAAPAG